MSWPLLRSRIHEHCRIIDISSGLTRVSVPGSSAYAAAKGAIEVLTRYLAKELGPRRITANVVAPGPVQTDAAIRQWPQLTAACGWYHPLQRASRKGDLRR